MEPTGMVVFTTVGRPYYGFDIFSVPLTSSLSPSNPTLHLQEHRLTDGLSINYNGSFTDDDQTLLYISERTGSPQIFLTHFTPGENNSKSSLLSAAPCSHFCDRPILRNGRIYFISAHEQPDAPFQSWSALYSATVSDAGGNYKLTRLTAEGVVDYSPAISGSGNFIAVASYGSKPWAGEFHQLYTDIVVFSTTSSNRTTERFVVAERGGWPTWSADHTIFFHRQADDGWWSIYRVDLSSPPNQLSHSGFVSPHRARRITPPGLHAFTPAAFHDGKKIAVATRRKGKAYRHIEIFDLESEEFYPVTELLNPNLHHYNPFVSPGSKFLGYHRFRGTAESTIPNLEVVRSPISTLRMLRLNGSFPSFSPDGNYIAFNHDFDANGGLKIVRSDGSKRWTLIKGRTAFYNSWSPTEKNVIFTSLGPIFQSAKTAVQIARVTFNSMELVRSSNEDGISVDIRILTREDTGNNAFPACSPDGKSVVFRSGRSGYKNLYIIDAVDGEVNGVAGNGSGIRRLTEGPWIDTMPSWSPNGNWIAFSSNMHDPDNDAAFSVYLIRPDGSSLTRVKVAGMEADRERINHVCFSQDCEWLLFTSNIGGVTAEPVSLPNQFQPYGDLFVVRVDGSGLRRLTWNGYENGTPAWYGGSRTGEEREFNAADTITEDIEKLALGTDRAECDLLEGQFDEPLWITCDF